MCYTHAMNITQTAQNILATHYQGLGTPVDIPTIAYSMGLVPYMNAGEARATWDLTTVRGYGPTPSQQKFALAYALAQRVLAGGKGDHGLSQWANSYDPQNINAQLLAGELLVPTYSLNVVVVDQGCTSVEHMARIFGVDHPLIVDRLKRRGYVR